VGRFLEHSRIYFFENAGDSVLYLSSADWMPRNLVRRVEIAFPIEDSGLRNEIIQQVLPALLNDRVKARQLQPDGTYVRLHPEKDQPASQAQLFFRQNSRDQAKRIADTKKARSIKLTPIKAPPGQK
jgi:polyphosphate kinase